MVARWRAARSAAAALCAAAALVAGTLAAGQPAARAASGQLISVDGASSGRAFDGVGGLSAGASSRLLYDYPAAQRAQILDYLFKPGYGASLPVLKVEIGGDTNSTDGAEPSHMRTPSQVDCTRGYEWWLMEQARQRNPGIKLYALEWGAPGWVGGGQRTLWTSQNITYLLSWLGCARQHGLQISYLGGWNEAGYDASWYTSLRQALDAHGYSGVQLVAADSFGWGVAGSMASDPAFSAAVAAVGVHYPCGYLGGYTDCPSTATAQGLGKPLWASEQGSQPYDTGAIPLARALNREYVDGRMTGTVNWSLVWSAYDGLPFGRDGLMLANTPWSGHYVVGPSIWAVAHTTQFTEPGWRYLDSGSARLSGGGSVVSLRSPSGNQWTSVAETTTATAPQQVTYDISGGLPAGTVHVWATNMDSGAPGQWFRHVADVQPGSGSFSYQLQPGYLYTFTTTTGQAKGSGGPPVPPARAWQLPYTQNFDRYQAGTVPARFSALGGAFQAGPCAAGPPAPSGPPASGSCLEQVITSPPVTWWGVDNEPVTVAGDATSWRDYRADVDALLQQPGYVELDGRALGPGNGLTGYHFRISDQGTWALYKEASAGFNAPGTDTTLASGAVPFGLNAWHRLGLDLRGDQISAVMDGHPLATVTDSSYQVGQVALQVSPWARAQFDNLSVRPEPVPAQDQAPQLGPVAAAPVQIPAPGSSARVLTTVTSPGGAAVTGVSARLQPPAGWTAMAVTRHPASLARRQTAALAWRLTAPSTAAPGLYQARLVVSYQAAGRQWTTATPVPVYLALHPAPGLAPAPGGDRAGEVTGPGR